MRNRTIAYENDEPIAFSQEEYIRMRETTSACHGTPQYRISKVEEVTYAVFASVDDFSEYILLFPEHFTNVDLELYADDSCAYVLGRLN